MKQNSRVFLILGGLLAASVHIRAEVSIDDRIASLEARLLDLSKENVRLRRDLGLDGAAGLAVARPAGREPVFSLNGLVQAQAEFGDKGDSRGSINDRFRLRRVRLGAAGRFLEEVDFKAEGEYVGTSVALTDGYINYSHFPWANVRIGQFKTPFGHEFLASDPKLFTIERTLGSDRLTLNRQVGAQTAGDFIEKRFSYALGVFNGSGANVTTNDNEKFLYAGRFAAVPWQGRCLGQPGKLGVGVDGFVTRDSGIIQPADFGLTSNSFTGKREGAGADAQFSLGRLELWAEYLRVRYAPKDARPAAEFTAASWYVQAAVFVIPTRFQAVARYEQFDPSDNRLNDETKAWTFGLNYFIKGDDLKLQCNYVRSDAPFSSATQNQLMLRTQVIF